MRLVDLLAEVLLNCVSPSQMEFEKRRLLKDMLELELTRDCPRQEVVEHLQTELAEQ